MICEEVRRNLSGFIDKELDAKKNLQINNHIKTCKECSFQKELLIKSVDKIKTVVIPTISPLVLNNILITKSDSQEDILENTASNYKEFQNIVKSFGLLTFGFILLLVFSPFGLILTSLIKGLFKDLYYLFSLLFKVTSRIPLTNDILVISLVFLIAAIPANLLEL